MSSCQISLWDDERKVANVLVQGASWLIIPFHLPILSSHLIIACVNGLIVDKLHASYVLASNHVNQLEHV